jgi:hypothetical protein
MIGQATCHSRCQVLFPLSARARDGANRSCRYSQQATSRASSISTEWEACRHRRVKLASRSRNVPLIRSIKEVCKTLPLFQSRREAGGLVPPDRCRHPTNHFDYMLALGPFDNRADEQTWPCQKPTPSLSSEAPSFFAKHASNTLGIGSPPISHNEQFLQRQATLLHQMEQGIGQMAMRDASPTTPPSHKRVLIWRAIAIQGIKTRKL